MIGDGARWIWNFAEQRFSAATQIVDLFHAREHLHDLADYSRSASPTPPPGHSSGSPTSVTAPSKRSPPPPAATTSTAPKPTNSTKAVAYVETNAHRMRYAYYRKLGMVVGPGVVEAVSWRSTRSISRCPARHPVC